MSAAAEPLGKAMYVATQVRLDLAPERATQAVRAKQRSTRLRVPEAVGFDHGPRTCGSPSRESPEIAARARQGVDGITVKTRARRGGRCLRSTRCASELRSGTLPPEPGATSADPESQGNPEASPAGHSHRERQGSAGCGEEHLGADLRGGLLSDLVRLPARQVVARGSRAPSDVLRPA